MTHISKITYSILTMLIMSEYNTHALSCTTETENTQEEHLSPDSNLKAIPRIPPASRRPILTAPKTSISSAFDSIRNKSIMSVDDKNTFNTIMLFDADGKTQCEAILLMIYAFENALNKIKKEKNNFSAPITFFDLIDSAIGFSSGSIVSTSVASNQKILKSLHSIVGLNSAPILSSIEETLTNTVFAFQNLVRSVLRRHVTSSSPLSPDQYLLNEMHYDAFHIDDKFDEEMTRLFNDLTTTDCPKAEFSIKSEENAQLLLTLIKQNILNKDTDSREKIANLMHSTIVEAVATVGGATINAEISNLINDNSSGKFDADIEDIQADSNLLDLTNLLFPPTEKHDNSVSFEETVDKLLSYKPKRDLIIISFKAETSPLNGNRAELSLSPVVMVNDNNTTSMFLQYTVTIPTWMYNREKLSAPDVVSILNDTINQALTDKYSATGIKKITNKLIKFLLETSKER